MTPRVLARRLAPLDAAFLYIESDAAPMHIGGVGLIDGDVPAAAYRACLAERLHEAPRYRQRVAAPPLGLGHPIWETDAAFDLARHVRETWLEPPGDDQQLKACAARLFAHRLGREHPLWELHVVRGLRGGGSALVSKIHHCMVDGISGAELLEVIFDPAPTGRSPRREPRVGVASPAGAWGLAGDALRETASTGVGLASAALRTLARVVESWPRALDDSRLSAAILAGTAARPVVRLPFNRPLTGARRLGWLRCHVEEVRSIREALGGTLNDVVLAVLTDAIGRDLARRRFDVRGRLLRVLMPVSIRGEHERGALGNRVSMIPIDVPFDGAPKERLAWTMARTAEAKRSGLAGVMSTLESAAGLLPAPLYATALALAASPALLTWSAPLRDASFVAGNLVCTNVPGPPVPLYVAGRRLLAHYPLVPLGFETGLNCAVFTYDQWLHFGLVADAAAVDDLEPLTHHVRDAFHDLCRAAGVAARAGADAGSPHDEATDPSLAGSDPNRATEVTRPTRRPRRRTRKDHTTDGER